MSDERGSWLRAPHVAVAALIALVFAGSQLRDASAQEAPPVSRERIERALARYAHEPRVEQLVAAALALERLDPGRARDAADRARLSGLLPQARASVQRGTALDLSERQTGTTGGTILSTDDELVFGGSLLFRLDRLLFAAEESSLLRERRELETRRLELVTQLVTLYYERRRLQLERDLGGRTDIELELGIARAEALLDVFTDGAFSRMMGGARQPESEVE